MAATTTWLFGSHSVANDGDRHSLDAVKEFQVWQPAQRRVGRTAGGIINVIQNQGPTMYTGSAFYYQRHEKANRGHV